MLITSAFFLYRVKKREDSDTEIITYSLFGGLLFAPVFIITGVLVNVFL